MKFAFVLMLVAVAAAAPRLEAEKGPLITYDMLKEAETSPDTRNILINALVRQLIAYIRRVINNGSDIFNIPPLDPLELENFHLYVPAGLINLDLELDDIYASGFGGFVVHTSNLNLRDLTFDIDISVPTIDIRAGSYDLTGDFFTAIPLFGKGEARFEVENFRFSALIYLGQSEDGTSVIFDRIENASFELPRFKSQLTGVIGGGDIDAIINTVIEEVIIDYINRFQGLIASTASRAIVLLANPILEQLDTWRFIAPLIPS